MTRAADHASRTLEDLEGDSWGSPPPGATRLVATAHALRQRPIGTLSAEDLRLLLGQRVGVEHLVPLALEQLRLDPLAAGDLYEGALLKAVLSTDRGYWSTHPDLAAQLHTIVADLDSTPPYIAAAITDFLEIDSQSP